MTELAVLVPVLARPGNVAPLVTSFLAGCPTDSELFFIPSWPVEGAEADVLAEAVGNPRVRWTSTEEAGTWPEKINFGVTVTAAPWILCAADDITFETGWWDATAYLRSRDEIGVIGTADCHLGQVGNPAVAAGAHTCHPLVRRSYIQNSGTVDELGKAVHDGYSHWCVDDELVTTAKMRQAWAFCRESVLLHNHPYWQRGTWDETYAAGEANSQADMALWKARAKEFFDIDVAYAP